MDRLPRERETWANRAEFILSSVGYAVGIGNVWRFPYVCFSGGGGAFLIPYLTMMCLCAIPLVFVEFTVGQYTKRGPVEAFINICPLMKGVGVAMVMLSFIVASYNNTVLTWVLYYLFHSFTAPLPWQLCNATWNIPENCSSFMENATTHLQSATKQFFDHRLLEITEGIENVGHLRWELVGILLLIWAVLFFCVFKGIRSTGKVVYFTALFPYVVLLALLFNNVRLPGALDGILFFLTPKWNKLGEIHVWIDATAQIFYSIGVGFGCLLSMASHNKHNNNILRDAMIVTLANSATSIFAGFVMFSGIGYMAHVRHLQVEQLAVEGPGLAFVVYPEIFSTMPVSQLWAFLFFLMLMCLGLDSQFALVEVMGTFVMDSFGPKILLMLNYKELVTLLLCFLTFLLGLPCITQGGVYIFQLLDYSVGITLMFTSLFEVVTLSWIFGVWRLSIMVKRILGKPPNVFFKACWLVVSPLSIVAILVTAMVQHSPLLYGKTYLYPAWAEGVAWIITFLSVGWIPLGAMHELLGRKGTCLAKLKASVTPRITLEEVCNVPVTEDQHQDHVKSLYSLSEVSPLHEEKDRGDMCDPE
ncbi:sodium- and chloride-dependent GABA transporter 1 [Salmo salar]|uniref:Sodium- and chloride-dependent GABA transporter 1 n=1 Tax=Salmo salar TaxID=8030 RepID=A0A1S3Q2D7_SALSA|nr:sodium- and chloride-dependent GABA transporter 1 [Salmo salar]|eukprot:XP_014034061.1 PREDICTED: sodium- and chloride-dependent GABA transporter 1-like [Salmo salar]